MLPIPARRSCLFLALLICSALLAPFNHASAKSIPDLLDQADVAGGIVVYLGDNAELAASLCPTTSPATSPPSNTVSRPRSPSSISSRTAADWAG